MSDGGQGHEGRPSLGHHYDSHAQQYESGKLGMWLFLVTEILLFGGLFCAYAVYRANHPEIFVYAHTFLDKTLGAVNTIVLLLSSLTMAWAVRAAQLGQRRLLVALLAVTLACACLFLGIKRIEYEEKWKHGLLWGERFRYEQLQEHGAGHGEASGAAHAEDHAAAVDGPAAAAGRDTEPADAAAGEPAAGAGEQGAGAPGDGTTWPAPGEAPGGLAEADAPGAAHVAAADIPHNVHVFFGIYFAMTGLHAVHVLAGMAVIIWLMVRAAKGHFGRRYFTPVDLGGLYWHLVDVIWIFLFPLLYLIH
jgi:cytochrome c oxidase subunit 3